MWNWLVFFVPFALGIVLGAAFARGWISTYSLIGVGIVLGFGAMLVAYLSASQSYDGTEGRQFLGRWWDPDLLATLVGLEYVLYLIGIGVGAFTREVVALFRRTD